MIKTSQTEFNLHSQLKHFKHEKILNERIDRNFYRVNHLSCEKPTIDQSDTPEVLIDPTPLEITASGFLFDAPVLHVIYREFCINNPEYTLKSQLDTSEEYYNHMENRLMELYPDKAYPGIVNDASLFFQEWVDSNYVAEDSIDYTLTDLIPTREYIKNEMNLTDDELYDFDSFESLASRYPSQPATYDEIMTIAEISSYKTQGWIGNVLAAIVAKPAIAAAAAGGVTVVAVGCYDAYWVLKNKKRAEEEQLERFDPGTGHNDLADAFRHISWTMMTRRYIGITRTKFYGWGNEQKRIFSSGGIECSEKWMDLHNNKVGYKTMYWFFRNKPTLSKKDYKGWCDRIETYIDSTHINGHHVLGSWLNSSSSDDYILTCKQIRKDHRKNISSIKYIFIK